MSNASSTNNFCRQVANLCFQHGVRHAVLCPGSRSAPLALAFLRHEGIQCFILSDERSAANTSLGIVQSTQNPIVIISTSGTAAINFHPAIAEAFFARVPFIALTADRPSEWLGQNDNQAVFQENLYGKHVAYAANLGPDYNMDDTQWAAERKVNEALITAKRKQQPVHLNFQFREPFYADYEEKFYPARFISNPEPVFSEVISFGDLKPEYLSGKKVMLLCGMHAPDEALSAVISALSSIKNLVCLTDVTSNQSSTNTIRWFDIIAEQRELNLLPDVLLTIGGPVVSKSLKNFLKTEGVKTGHWHISTEEFAPDTFKKLRRHINSKPEIFLKWLFNSEVDFNADFQQAWNMLQDQITTKWKAQKDSISASETGIVATIQESLPPNSILHLGNSLAIRHVNSFPVFNGDIHVFSNRGTSGIDGSVSTCVGHSLVSERTNILLVGDLSFIYDSNGLWNNYVKSNLKIIILNNHGGRIFHAVEGAASQPELEEYFVTHQPLKCEHLVKQFRGEYLSIQPDKIKEGLAWLYEDKTTFAVLEIESPVAPGLTEVKKLLY